MSTDQVVAPAPHHQMKAATCEEAPPPTQEPEEALVGQRSPCSGHESRSSGNEDHDDVESGNQSFVRMLRRAQGPKQVLLILLLSSISWGLVSGVGPLALSDKYARIRHGYDGTLPCSAIPVEERPESCERGSYDAQNAASISSFSRNVFTFTTSSLVGSLSDERGRRGILILGLFLGLLSPLALVLVQYVRNVSPTWYYALDAVHGIVSWIPIALSCLADVMPPQWRAPSFGLVMACVTVGFDFSPTAVFILSRSMIIVLSFALQVVGFVFAVIALPETVPPEVLDRAARVRSMRRQTERTGGDRPRIWKVLSEACRIVLRPLRELCILNRNRLFRILATLAFVSGMVDGGDWVLQIYYAENEFGATARDLAIIFNIHGVLNIFIQGVLLKLLISSVGERMVIALAFLFATINNILYGLATSKNFIFAAAVVASFGTMAFPTISAVKANNVGKHEQGRIQGALSALTSLAAGLGPLVMQFVFSRTKDYFPGMTFLFAAAVQLVAVALAFALPREKTDSFGKHRPQEDDDELEGSCEELEQPLLGGDLEEEEVILGQ